MRNKINRTLAIAMLILASLCVFAKPDGNPYLSGSVVDTDGHPVAGAVVTDGFTRSLTDGQGRFRFESPYPERVRFVSVRIPSGYSPVLVEGKTVFFAEVPAYSGKERKAVITLRKNEIPHDGYTVLMIADPQADVYNCDNKKDNIAYAATDIWEDLFEDMRDRISETQGPCVGICLGDIRNSGSSASVYPQYLEGLERLGVPFFQVIGNHDHLFRDADTDDESTREFEDAFGPRNYSFDLGQIHFVVLDNCIYKKGLRRYPMVYGLEDEYLEWLKGDLAMVPVDMPVMICTHANFFSANGVHDWVYDGIPCCYKFNEFLEAIQGFDKLYVWAGHTHLGDFIGRVESPANPSGIETFVIGRSTGPMPVNEYVSADGTPRGFVVMETSGKDVTWKYHPLQTELAKHRGRKKDAFRWKPETADESLQFHAYPRGAYDDDFVYANVFLWDRHWGTPVLRIGEEEYAMTRDLIYDLSYKEIIQAYKKQGGNERYAGPHSKHNFSVRVPDGASGTGTVEVTDRFGRKWTREVSIDPVEYDDGLKHIVFDFRTPPDSCRTEFDSGVSFSCTGEDAPYDFYVSCGYYKGEPQEDGHLMIKGKGSFITLPAVPGYKLAGITVHPSGNRMASQSASIETASGKRVSGGEKLVFWGNGTDSWTLSGTQENTSYRIVAADKYFRIGELRLVYKP